MRKLFAAGIAALLLSNCAAMFNGSTRQVAIRSNEDNAEIYVNEAYIGKNSGVTTLRKKENYTISVKKEGCTASSVPVDKTFDATTLLGVFIDFGVISILVVDGLATGAWQDFPQTSYVVDPVCPEEASNN
jgi:hypothetical protein